MNNRMIRWLLLLTALLLPPLTLHARWMNPNTGRFHTMDTYEGDQEEPLSLHKYLYASCNPINRIDPSGNDGNLLELDLVMDTQFTEKTKDAEEAEVGKEKATAGIAALVTTLAIIETQLASLEDKHQNDDDESLFRSMKMQGATPEPGSTKRNLGVKTDGVKPDITPSPTGIVQPGGGMSVARNTPWNLEPHRRPSLLQGTGRDPVWGTTKSLLLQAGNGLLQFVPDTPIHATIQPSTPMPLTQYQQALAGTALAWELVVRGD